MPAAHPVSRLLGETTLGLAEAATRFPGCRKATASNRQRVRRWIERGVEVAGVRVKLEAVRSGNNWFTSAEAIARFLAAQNPPPAAPPASPARQSKASRAAERELIRKGL